MVVLLFSVDDFSMDQPKLPNIRLFQSLVLNKDRIFDSFGWSMAVFLFLVDVPSMDHPKLPNIRLYSSKVWIFDGFGWSMVVTLFSVDVLSMDHPKLLVCENVAAVIHG